MHIVNGRERSAEAITFDERWRAYGIHAAYCVLASCQAVTFPQHASASRQAHADAFLQRAEAAIEDLDALGAVRDAGLR